MANQEGSMGAAIVIGFVAFMVLNALLGAIMPYCTTDYLGQSYCYSMGVSGGLIGSVILGWGMLFLGMFSLQFIGAIIAALIAGMLAGMMAKGSGGRGFMAGFGASMIGYFIMLLIAFIVGVGMYSAVPAGYGAYEYGAYESMYYSSFAPGLNAQLGGMGGMGINNLMASGALLLVGIFIIIPIASGVIAGIGGMIMSSLFAKPASGQQQQSAPVISTVVQAGPGYAQPQYQQAPPVQQIQPSAPVAVPAAVPAAPIPVAAPAHVEKAKPASTAKAKTKTEATPAKKVGGKVSCSKCGKENAADATFCEECGMRLKA